MSRTLYSILLLILVISGCSRSEKHHLFEYVEPSRSKITFSNTIVQNDSVNPDDCLNCFNGGGVGVGDFNNDGLPDLVFSGSQVASKLYLNQGSLEFRDVSAESNFVTSSWVTGVNVVDLNADGWDDIYLNVGGVNCDSGCNNLLFINRGNDAQGIPTFVEMASEYGLDDARYAQQSVFYDYDMDGDLDVYIVHNKNKTNFNRNTPRPKDRWPEYLTDYMLRNDSVEGVDHPVFTNVSEELGLSGRGFGLGLGIADLNNDQRIDLYVSNDFITDDFLYLNKTSPEGDSIYFEEASRDYLGHVTTNAMGMDIADINDDGISDILVLDMLPNDFKRHKRVMMQMNYGGYMMVTGRGYTPQYMRNTLQLGNGMLNGKPLRSSEAGLLYGVSSTDWSWAPLIVDFDNDGDKDIYVTNGYIKDVIDRDYIQFSMPTSSNSPKFNSVEKYLEDLPEIKPPNMFYEQKGTHDFEDVSDTWIEERISLSNGVAYADFDLDGDLDLAVNNINQEAFLLENKTSEKLENHYLRIKLRGQQKNRDGIGSKITVWADGSKQYQFQSVIRGYLSCVEPILHFGMQTGKVDSIRVVWPDGKVSFERDVAANQVLEIEQGLAVDKSSELPLKNETEPNELMFTERNELLKSSHIQLVNTEFMKQPLLMRQYSQKGPALAAADLDGTQGEEIYVGGGLNVPGRIWAQDETGEYHPVQVLDSINEETDAVFFDADNDKDMDLYVASGGNLFEENSPYYKDRLYLNDGLGNFTLDPEALPEITQSSDCVIPIDIDHDRDLDLFVGSRLTPKNYPKAPKSHMLINDNGKFTQQEGSGLEGLGMVSDAVWEDLDGDGWEDLIAVGEFMAITVFKNKEGKLSPMDVVWYDENHKKTGSEGWWNCIAAADFDKDGDIDFIAGNQGLNSFVKPGKGSPLYIYNGDFDKNGSYDPILGQYFPVEGKKRLFPIHTKDDIEKQFPDAPIKLLTYEQFADIEYTSLLEIDDLESETLKATTFASSYIENLGGGKFKLTPLPTACQLAPVNDILIGDFDGNEMPDALLVGNDFSSEANYGRFDALTGVYLKGTPSGFEAVPSRESGFYVPGQSNHLIRVTDRFGKKLILAGQNNEKLKVFE